MDFHPLRPSGTGPYVSTAIAADYLGIAKRTLDDMRLRGGGPVFYRMSRTKHGRSPARYTYPDLDSWAAERRGGNTGQV